MRIARSLPHVLTLGALACGDPTGPDGRATPGLLLTGDAPMTSLVAPETARAGERFDVTVSSFGSGNCTRPARDQVRVTGLRAEIRLYDFQGGAATGCTRDLRQFPRTVRLTFDRPGRAEIVVIGRDGAGAPRTVSQAVVVE